MKKNFLYLALALGIGVNNAYAASSSAENSISVANSAANTESIGPIIKLAFLPINSNANSQTTMANLQSGLSAMQAQLTKIKQHIQLYSIPDDQFFIENVADLQSNLINFQGVLNETAQTIDQTDESDTSFGNKVRTIDFLYTHLFENNYSTHEYKKDSSTESLQDYVENELTEKPGLDSDILTTNMISHFLDSYSEFNQNFIAQLPEQTDINGILESANDPNVIGDIGRSVWVLNSTFMQVMFDVLTVIQKQNMVAQALIILKKQDDRFKNVDLSALLDQSVVGFTTGDDWSLDGALIQNNQLTENIVYDVVNDINTLTIQFIGSDDHHQLHKEIFYSPTSGLGVESITYPTADSICQVTSFVHSFNSFDIQCSSESNKDLYRRIYHAAVGGLLNWNEDVFSSNIILENSEYNEIAGVGKITFTPTINHYDNKSLSSYFVNDGGVPWYDNNDYHGGLQEFLDVAATLSNINPLYSYHHSVDPSVFDLSNRGERQDYYVVYLPYSGSFVQIAANVGVFPGGFLDLDGTHLTDTIDIQPLQNNANVKQDPNYSYTFSYTSKDVSPIDIPFDIIDKKVENYGFYQAGYASGEYVQFIGALTSQQYNASREFSYYIPPSFTYKNKNITIGGGWLSGYDPKTINFEDGNPVSVQSVIDGPGVNDETLEVHITIDVFDPDDESHRTDTIYQSNGDAEFHRQLSSIVTGHNTFGTIYFQTSQANPGMIEVVESTSQSDGSSDQIEMQ